MKTTSAKQQDTTASKTHALMVRIDGMGDVVTITANKDFTLQAKTVDIRTREVVADAKVTVLKDTVLHFVASSSLPGWYYICRVDAHGHISCTCPSRKPCGHMKQLADKSTADPCQMEDKQVPTIAQSVPALCPIVVSVAGVAEVVDYEEELSSDPLPYEVYTDLFDTNNVASCCYA